MTADEVLSLSQRVADQASARLVLAPIANRCGSWATVVGPDRRCVVIDDGLSFTDASAALTSALSSPDLASTPVDSDSTARV